MMSARFVAFPMPGEPGAREVWPLYPSGRPTAAQIWSAREPAGGVILPPVYVSEADHRRIRDLIATQAAGDPSVAGFLAGELDRAVLRRAEDLPEDAVAMNAHVVFRTDADRGAATGVLVYPDEDRLPAGRPISVLSPLGAALLGLREGTGMAFADRDGTPNSVRVEAVTARPAAKRRCR